MAAQQHKKRNVISPSYHAILFLLYKTFTIHNNFWASFRRFSKIFPEAKQTFCKIFQTFS